jgi:5S rRNA maturation endonuclease (ribonuclease M5)
MATNIEKTTEKVFELLERLAKETAKGTLIIVEGRKDVSSLRKLGIEGNIVSAKTRGKSILDILGEVEKLGSLEIVVLMDFDRRGRELSKRLVQGFERMRIKPNLVFWNALRRLVGREVKDIEGLASYIETLKRKAENSVMH